MSGLRQLGPGAFTETVHVVEELDTMGQCGRARPRDIEQRPLQARVAHVDREKAHGGRL